MEREMMIGKIHRATVTRAELDYVGSITIDAELMARADILAHQKVQVVDIDNGARFETYAICGEPNSGILCVNGAAARLVQPNDRVIVIAYALMPDEEARSHEPKVVLVDERNVPHDL